MMINSLKKQIRQKEERIQAKKDLIRQQYHQLKNNIHDEITSPTALLLAFTLGFVVTHQYSDQKLQLSQLTQHLLTARNLFMLLGSP